MHDRRRFLSLLISSAALSLAPSKLQALEQQMEELIANFAMIRQLVAHENQRPALIVNFNKLNDAVQATGGMSIFEDANDQNSIWVIEFWRSQEDYRAALARAPADTLLKEQLLLIAETKTRAEIKLPTMM